MPFWDGSFGIAESPYCMEPVPWWLDLSSQLDEQNTHRIASWYRRNRYRGVCLEETRKPQSIDGQALQVSPSVWGVSESLDAVYRYFCLQSTGMKQQSNFGTAESLQVEQISARLVSVSGMERRGEELLHLTIDVKLSF